MHYLVSLASLAGVLCLLLLFFSALPRAARQKYTHPLGRLVLVMALVCLAAVHPLLGLGMVLVWITWLSPVFLESDPVYMLEGLVTKEAADKATKQEAQEGVDRETIRNSLQAKPSNSLPSADPHPSSEEAVPYRPSTALTSEGFCGSCADVSYP